MSNIIDVAKAAGVSTGTVSKYLNHTGYVSPQKKR
jgi:DNA-binding LacI/PurR family transcriptional regulator